MAYSDWGAYVFRNGERRTDREDVAIFDDQDKDLPSGARVFANIARQLERGETDWSQHSHHAVLGDAHVRLCGYKARPELWHINGEGTPVRITLTPYLTERDTDGDEMSWEGEFRGFRFDITHVLHLDKFTMLLALHLIEPDGSDWTSLCGYLFGAGHSDVEDGDAEEKSKHWWIKRLHTRGE